MIGTYVEEEGQTLSGQTPAASLPFLNNHVLFEGLAEGQSGVHAYRSDAITYITTPYFGRGLHVHM